MAMTRKEAQDFLEQAIGTKQKKEPETLAEKCAETSTRYHAAHLLADSFLANIRVPQGYKEALNELVKAEMPALSPQMALSIKDQIRVRGHAKNKPITFDYDKIGAEFFDGQQSQQAPKAAVILAKLERNRIYLTHKKEFFELLAEYVETGLTAEKLTALKKDPVFIAGSVPIDEAKAEIEEVSSFLKPAKQKSFRKLPKGEKRWDDRFEGYVNSMSDALERAAEWENKPEIQNAIHTLQKAVRGEELTQTAVVER